MASNITRAFEIQQLVVASAGVRREVTVGLAKVGELEGVEESRVAATHLTTMIRVKEGREPALSQLEVAGVRSA